MKSVRGGGRPAGPMAVRSRLPTHSAAEIREVLAGLPTATGYRVTVKPLRYRTAPHLQAFTYWDEPEIVLQVPEPFRPFREMVDLGADGTPIVLSARAVRSSGSSTSTSSATGGSISPMDGARARRSRATGTRLRTTAGAGLCDRLHSAREGTERLSSPPTRLAVSGEAESG